MIRDGLIKPMRKALLFTMLLLSTDVLGEADQTLIATMWRWQQTLYGNGRKLMPTNPDRYTLKLLPDGRLNIRADCNLGGGSYTVNDDRISIEITHSTRAACPPESMDRDYVRDLNAAAKYFLKDDGLHIELKDDGGTMRFVRD